MKTYKDNFNEFGELRPDHSRWTVGEVAATVASFACVIILMTGYLPTLFTQVLS